MFENTQKSRFSTTLMFFLILLQFLSIFVQKFTWDIFGDFYTFCFYFWCIFDCKCFHDKRKSNKIQEIDKCIMARFAHLNLKNYFVQKIILIKSKIFIVNSNRKKCIFQFLWFFFSNVAKTLAVKNASQIISKCVEITKNISYEFLHKNWQKL